MAEDKAPAVDKLQASAGLVPSVSSPEEKELQTNFASNQPQQVKPALTLEQWAQSILEPTDAEASPTINLSRFGLKTANDVIKFMKSPAGESTLAELGAQLALEDAIQHQRQIEQQEHNILMLRIQALLFLWFLDEKSDAAEKIRDLVINQNQQAIERATPHATTQTTSSSTHHGLELAIAGYNDAIRAAEEKQAKIREDEVVLEKEAHALTTEGKHLTEKYEVYNNSLEEFDRSIDDHHEIDQTEIMRMMNKYTEELVHHVEKINQVIEVDEDATRLLHVHTALNLKVGSLQDMLAVHKGEKYYANAEGQQVKSFKDADFVLTKDQKIVKENGKYYLLKAGQDWNSVKDNPEAQKQAETAYERTKHDMMSVRKIVLHNKGLEITIHKERVQEVQNKVVTNKAEKLLVGNQIGLLQAARAGALDMLKNPNLNQEAPRPTPTAGHAAVPKPSQASATTFYREQLQEQKTRHYSRADLLALADQAPEANRQAANAYLQAEFANMPRKGPIPYQFMQAMLKNLERFGVDMNKPAVTSIQSDTEKSQSPNPFSTKPDPFKS